ncbi:MAG: hypothetical protein Q8S54_19585 [Bacteroidota bacterium]|nr:hypothetical protein [Odoribacter sp.]MDP3645373.1 hypothetical protein [Bacteroidota bacterium]
MKKFLYVFTLIICLIGIPVLSGAQNNQDSIKKYRVETIDGNEYIGKIIDRSADKIRIKTEKLGEISILNKDVQKITEVTTVVVKDGTYWFDNPQSTRYLWAPNGYSLKKGEGYYQNVWILGNQAIYGITNHFSAGLGVIPLFLFAGAPTPVWITAKYTVPVVENKINLGTGALLGTIIGVGAGTDNYAGILYGISTFGSKDKNLSIGMGWGFAGGEMASRPTININGMIRTGAKGYFITENYFIATPDNFMVLMSLGGRRIIKNVGLDFGAFIPLGGDIGSFVAIPWLGFTIPFGTKN